MTFSSSSDPLTSSNWEEVPINITKNLPICEVMHLLRSRLFIVLFFLFHLLPQEHHPRRDYIVPIAFVAAAARPDR